MKKSREILVGALAAALGFAAGAQAQDQSASGLDMSGQALYKRFCTACHGVDATGDGPIASALRFRPADLTRIAARTHGTFEKDKVRRMIDGREPVKGHGGPDMPLWGDALKHSGEGFSEEAVRNRIGLLVDYLETLQVK